MYGESNGYHSINQLGRMLGESRNAGKTAKVDEGKKWKNARKESWSGKQDRVSKTKTQSEGHEVDTQCCLVHPPIGEWAE
jgi:hypothetical protein